MQRKDSAGILILILAGIVLACQGCGTSTLARMGRSGRAAGTGAADYIQAEYGPHSVEAERLAEAARNFDRAAGLLASEEPISATDQAEIEDVIRSSAAITTAGEPYILIATDVLTEVLRYVRSASLDLRYRAYAARFLRSTADALYDRLRSYVPERGTS